MSNQHSVIEHRANYFFLKIEEDYIAIFPEEDKHRHCKAAILSIIEHWMNSKRTETSQDNDLYVYLSYPQFSKQMFGLFSRSTIIKCLRDLVIDGVICSHPYVDSFNQKTFAYMLNIDVVNAKLRALPERKGSVKIHGGSVNLNDPGVNVNGGSSKSKLPPSKSKRNIDYIDNNIDSSQTDKEEGMSSPIVDDAHTSIIDFEERKASTDKHKAINLKEQSSQQTTTVPPVGEGQAALAPVASVDTPQVSTQRGARTRKPVTQAKQPFTLDAQQQAFWDLWCNVWFNAEIKPVLTETAYGHISTLAPYITDAAQLDSLIDYTRKDVAESIGMKRKMVQLGNMVHCYAGWKQAQKPLLPATIGATPRKDFTGMGRLLKAN